MTKSQLGHKTVTLFTFLRKLYILNIVNKPAKE